MMKRILAYLLVLSPILGWGQTRNIRNMVQPVSGPTIAITPLFLGPFSNQTGTASGTSPVTYSFSSLTGNNGSITLPSWAEGSINSGSTYAGSFSSLANGSGTLLVRVKASTASGSYGPSNVVFSATGATTQNCSIQATVSALSPSLTATPTSLTIPSTLFGTRSSSVSFNINGTNLTGIYDTVRAPANTNISIDGVNFFTSYLVPISGGTINNQVVYVVTTATAPVGTFSGNVAMTTPGISGPVNCAVSGTVTSSTTTYYFAFSHIQATVPSGFVNCYGDPFTGVRTFTNGPLTLSSVATTSWHPYASDSAAYNTLGFLGSTVPNFPDSVLRRAWFNYSGPNHFGDSSVQGLGNKMIVISGCNTSHAYTIVVTYSIITGFTATNKVRIVGASTYISSLVNWSGNTSQYVTFTNVFSDGTGNLTFYFFTEPGQQIAGVSGLSIQ